MNVLSLFDGMSCGQLALKKAGIKVDKYFASEIDKYAMQVTQHNFPDTIQLGDVTKVRAQDLPKIDLIIGGSPCQGFSFAGKGLNFEDERSKLFFEFVRLVKECNPKYFLLENVKMKKEHELVISQYMKVAPIEINSALVSAQNRVRLFWTNIAQKPYGLFDDMITDIPQPKDKGILLKDILESEVAEKFYLSERMINSIIRHKEKHKELGNGFGATIMDPTEKSNTLRIGGGNEDKLLYEKSNTISARYYKDGGECLIVASRGRNPENPKSRESGLETKQMLEPRFDGKTNCITSVQKDNLVMQLNGSTESGGVQPYAILEGAKIRRLTPMECERLQTVPDGYTSCVSDTQRYRMLGNGWTVDVIVHILNHLKI